MKNDPLMFVDSINIINDGNENQNTFDSRTSVKDLIHHRIDDINAMLMYNLNIICVIRLVNNEIYEGKPIRVNEKYLELSINNKTILFELNSIIDIGLRKKL
ncbi:MAG: hypothetical protein ACI35W_01200 [Anaeroplasmataceae bacterium]